MTSELVLPNHLHCEKNVKLAPLTTISIGGEAEYFVVAESLEDLISIYDFAARMGLSVHILGKGSNLLIDDAGIKGITLQLGSGFTDYSVKGERIIVGGGLSMPRLARLAVELGSSGFEWMIGVPGSVGAGVAINAGTTQQCIQDNLLSAVYLTPQGQIIRESTPELSLRYRGSKLLDQGYLVLEATFKLDFSQSVEIVGQKTQEYVKKRRDKFPLRYPNCGSVFKRPFEGKGSFTGQLIESTGLKGLQQGKAQISPIHANFIINLGGASSDDVKTLINIAQERVLTKHGIFLEREVRYFPEYL